MDNDSRLILESEPTFAQRAAEAITEAVGSWKFVITQSIILTVWVILNIVSIIKHWDPYPFILMNLFLSLQAAYTAPMILMAQNRQAEIDRKILHEDWKMDKDSNRAILQIEEDIHNHMMEQNAKLNAIMRRLGSLE